MVTGHPPNHSAFGTFVTHPTDAGSAPKASGGRPLRTLGKHVRRIFFVSILLLATCAHAEETISDPVKRIDLVRGISIPLPQKTPYDSDPDRRATYLEEYKIAYRTVLAAVAVECHMSVKGRSEEPMRAGWEDGRTAALILPSDQAAAALGLSVDEYRNLLSTTFGIKTK